MCEFDYVRLSFFSHTFIVFVSTLRDELYC